MIWRRGNIQGRYQLEALTIVSGDKSVDQDNYGRMERSDRLSEISLKLELEIS